MGSDFPWFTVAAVVLAVAAVVVAVLGVRVHAALRRLREHGVRTEGAVVQSTYGGFGSGGEHSAPRRHEVVSFDAQGRTVTGRPLAEDFFHEDRSGAPVTVVFDPEDPSRFIAPVSGDRLSRSPLARRLSAAFLLALLAGFMVLLSSLFSYLETVGP